MDYDDILIKVTQITSKVLNRQFSSEALLPLDSVSLLNLLFEIESEFGFEFDVTKISQADFDQIDKIAKYLAARL